MTLSNEAARDHLALALDVDDLVVALRIARPLLEYFSVAKVGLELFAASGPESVVVSRVRRFRCVRRPEAARHPDDCRSCCSGSRRTRRGLRDGAHFRWLAMVEAATAGMAEGATSAGLPVPCVLGVTVLTSDSEAADEELARKGAGSPRGRLRWCRLRGRRTCRVVADAAPGLRRVVPGIRPSQVGHDDQARVATPGAAMRAGADLLVDRQGRHGRSPTLRLSAARIHDEVAAELDRTAHDAEPAESRWNRRSSWLPQ